MRRIGTLVLDGLDALSNLLELEIFYGRELNAAQRTEGEAAKEGS